MADTIRGGYPDVHCSDCGALGCAFAHWGPLVPQGQKSYFCPDCFHDRSEDGIAGREPKPLGYKLNQVTNPPAVGP